MFEKLIRAAIEHRWLVMLAVIGMAAVGVFNYQKLPIDAVPDITNVQVQINTQAPGYSPLETEQRVTYPIETVMAGLPSLEQTRSLSRYGLSQVTVIFKDGTDIYFARQLVNERIQEARDKLPQGIAPALGPISTGLGEIYLWTVEAKDGAKKPNGTPYTATDLREIQDWIIKPQLRNVPGVTEINSIGGHAKEYQIAPNPERLASMGVTLQDIVTALERNNGNVGAGYIEKRGEQYLIRAPGQVRTIEDIGDVILRSAGGGVIRVRDVAEVGLGRELRTGAATDNGREVVLGTVFMLIGQNSRTVSQAVDKKMVEINRSLPEGVHAVTVYDRTVLVDKAISTVKKNLLEGAILVIVILFLFLGNIRAAIITATVIPLSMLFTFTGMVTYKVSANLMSLGALDFGIIIDGAVVIVENCVRRLAHAQAHYGRPLTRSERFHEVFLASKEARRALLFGQLIIMVVYLPIFALTGVEGKMFHPMAFTVVAALVGAMILSVTFIPAAVALFIGNRVSEKENFLMLQAKRWYGPLLDRVMEAKAVVLTAAAVAVVLCGLIATRMGSEFVPNLNEGDFAIQALRIPGTSLSQSVAMQRQLESELKAKFPEIDRIFARTGTAEIASDPMPPNISDGYIMLKPVSEWPEPRKSRDELLAAVQEVVGKIPGSNYEFSQPIQLRFNELISGVRSDVAVKIFGDDMDVLNKTGEEVSAMLQRIPGASEVKVEQTTGLPMLTVNIDRKKSARYGLNVADIQDVVATAIGGREAGTLFEGDRRFDILVRFPESLRNDLDSLRRLPIPLPRGTGGTDERTNFIPLAEVASFELAPGPNQVSREDGKRRIVVSANVRGRDVGSFVADAESALAQVKIPAGYWTRWGGTFENLQSATQRLQIVVPVSLLLVFTLLFAMFGNVKDGLIVFTGIPFALTGGIMALWLRDIPMSISAAVGFIALSGVAVLNGLVMISHIRSLREEGTLLDVAIRDGALTRLRPVLMTALVASLGFIPMAIATGTGAEVQRPLATVVIGGILSSTLLTLLVLPILYRLAHRPDEQEEDVSAEPLHPEVAVTSGPSQTHF
jgi:heavy metal efflux system protein